MESDGPHVRLAAGEITPEAEMTAAASFCLLLASLSGAALLAWWSLNFHRSNQHLWMVPAGLVIAGTPALIWISAATSGAWRRIELSIHTAPDLEK